MRMLQGIVSIQKIYIKTSTLKTPMSCNSFNIIYVAICSGCLDEYIAETV